MIRLETAKAQPCIWMIAGQIKYKLCQCHYDCEHCPLDAAMRGATDDPDHLHPPRLAARRMGTLFPIDRLYAAGHTWLQAVDDSIDRYRLGLDSFAASLIASPRRIRWDAAPHLLQVGESLLELDFDEGCLNLAAPLVARLIERNRTLDDHPDALISDPYGTGWLVTLTQIDPSAVARLASATSALERARLDMRRLRRRIALNLLAGDCDCTVASDAHSELFADPWHSLGGVGYLGLVQEVLTERSV